MASTPVSDAAGSEFDRAPLTVDPLFALSFDLMVIANAEGHFLKINPAFERTLGYSIAALGTRPFTDFIHPDDLKAGVEKFAVLAAGGAVLEFENRYRCKDGSYRWLLWNATAIDGGHIYATARDVTDREQILEQALQAGREQALESFRLKTEFLAGMSHELRTPLNGVIGMTDLLRGTSLDPVQGEYVEALAASGEALLAVVCDALDFSKMERGRLELDRSEFELRPLVEEATQMFTEQARSKGLELSHCVDAGLPVTVSADRTRLRQVLVNLLSNAVKFTASGAITVQASSAGGEIVKLSVSDSGIGIGEDQAVGLFEALRQGDQSTTRRHGGTGLGLAISRQIVELMGGEIAVEPNSDGGSVFSFSVELSAVKRLPGDEHPAPGRQTPPTPLDASRDPGPLALLVEDNEMNRMLAVALLLKLGVQTVVARDGREGVEMAGRDHYDLILMDCLMPEVDGFQATREIRQAETGRHVPIIAMTALSTPADRERCFAAGMDDYLCKPIRREVLDATIQRWLPTAARTSETAGGEQADLGSGSGEFLEVLHQSIIVELRETLAPMMRRQLMDEFDEQREKCLIDIRRAVHSGDRGGLRTAAHLLKGSSASLGINRLRLCCQRLEQSAADEDAEVGEEQLEELAVIAAEAGEALRLELV